MSDAQSFADFLAEANEGQATTIPVLAEGNYKGIFQGFGRKKDGKTNYLQYGIIQPTPGREKKGVGEAWFMVAARFEIDSAYARSTMGQDNNPFITSDGSCSTFVNIKLNPYGIDNQNIMFWGFVNGMLEKVGLATQEKDESGTVKWKRDPSITQAIYEGAQELRQELEEMEDLNKKLIPCKLMEKQLENISELLTSSDESRECFLAISRQFDAYQGRNVHVVKRVLTSLAEDADVFE